MPLSREQVQQAAADLAAAERDRRQIGLLSLRFAGMDMDDAYAVQEAFVGRRLAEGRQRIGWKIGLTSRAMQAALNIVTPDSGVLLDDMLFASGSDIPRNRFIQPRIEAEIAFVLARDLPPSASRDQVIAATDFVSPCLEILDTRILRRDPATGRTRTIVDTIADNAANAGLVMGAARHRVDAFDLRWVGAIVRRDGVVEETGLGAGVLDDPVAGIVWLSARLAQYGQTLRAGEIVLSGSFIRPVETWEGAEIAADFGPFGTVACRF